MSVFEGRNGLLFNTLLLGLYIEVLITEDLLSSPLLKKYFGILLITYFFRFEKQKKLSTVNILRDKE